jgi:NodT family efflux transporter outer membrane factor (OMF) lipoprotein
MVAVTLVVSGCTTVGPDYVRPPGPVAEQWIDIEDPRIKAEPAALIDWWTVFNDPVLTFLVDTAYKQNLTLQIAGLRILEARAQLGIAGGRQYPQVQQATGSLTRVELSDNAPNVVETSFTDVLIGFDTAWEIDFWGRFRRGVEAGNADLGASIANYDDVLVSLIAEVAATYVQIRTFEERLRLAQANVKIQKESLRIAGVRFRHGAVTNLDVQEATGNLRNTEALIPELETGLRQAKNALSILLGMPPHDLQDLLGDPRPIPTAPVDVAVGVPADLLRRRPDIRRAEREAAAQSALIGVAKSDLYPRFTLAGFVGLESSNIGSISLADVFTGSSFTGFVGPAVSWPLLNYGRLKNNVRVQDARFQQLVINYQNTVLKAAEEVENAVVAFLRAQEQVRFLSGGVQATKQAVDLSLIQYRAGAIPFDRVLISEERLVAQQDRLAEAKGAISVNLIAMYKGLGGGWQIRRGQDFVPGEITEVMRKRTDWGGLLAPEDVSPKRTGILPSGPDW